MNKDGLRLRVANPPSRPLMIFDGDCHFCRKWIERWRVMTAGRVDYAPYQEVAEKFPEISREEFDRAVQFVETNGDVVSGAEAVFRSLRYARGRRWLTWCYDRLPGFAAATECGYGLVARNRKFSSTITQLFWGSDVGPPTYFWARRWFLRLVGLVYLIAFASLWLQVDGLIGAKGILPVGEFLTAIGDRFGSQAWLMLPTLCWFNPGDGFLHLLCGSGILLSILLILGIAPVIALAGLFVSYLSLMIAGQAFLSFQWDILLLEAGFLSIFLAPVQLWPRRNNEQPVSRPGMFLAKLLLFKLMLMSGVVKLTSGDPSWWDLSALDFHYWSQPLPTVFAWWADQHPEWFKKFSVAFCLVVEIIVPFFIWSPRRPRLIAAALLIFLQVAIALTGNYCFFNLLTIALCLLLIDDATVGSARCSVLPSTGWDLSARLLRYAAMFIFVLTLPLNGWLIVSAFKPESEWPRVVRLIQEKIAPFHIVNGYGLFRVMTKDRGEIVVQGSADGIDWLPYEFRWKPGEISRAPGWCAPHQPRLDWQMWFAALGSPRERRWFERFAVRLLEGERDVIQLLEENPFPDAPPRYIRAVFYRYRFTDANERREAGAWWKRREIGEYLTTVSLQNVR